MSNEDTLQGMKWTVGDIFTEMSPTPRGVAEHWVLFWLS